MPLYEYVCRTCRGAFETYVRSWGEEVRCRSCGGGDVEKKLSTFATVGASRDSAPVSGGSCCAGGGCRCC